MCLISGLTPNLRTLLFSSFKCHWELYKISLFHSACAPMWVYIYSEVLLSLFRTKSAAKTERSRTFLACKIHHQRKIPKVCFLAGILPVRKALCWEEGRSGNYGMRTQTERIRCMQTRQLYGKMYRQVVDCLAFRFLSNQGGLLVKA